jgi:hypothetical protein
LFVIERDARLIDEVGQVGAKQFLFPHFIRLEFIKKSKFEHKTGKSWQLNHTSMEK